MAGSHTRPRADDPSAETVAGTSHVRLVSTSEAGLSEQLAGRVDGHLERFAKHMREGLLAASTAVGLEVMAELMDADVTELAGPKGRHDPDRAATRHGSEAGSVTLGGRRSLHPPLPRGAGAGRPGGGSASGTSRSEVSRRFVATTAERLAELEARPLGNQRWLVVFIDGFGFANHTMVGALGVTAEGTKVPLGIVEGSTENAAGCAPGWCRGWPSTVAGR